MGHIPQLKILKFPCVSRTLGPCSKDLALKVEKTAKIT